jgi:hypothetical protein
MYLVKSYILFAAKPFVFGIVATAYRIIKAQILLCFNNPLYCGVCENSPYATERESKFKELKMYTIYIIEEESFNRIAVADLVYLTEEEADHAAQKLQDHFHSLCISLRVIIKDSYGAIKVMS